MAIKIFYFVVIVVSILSASVFAIYSGQAEGFVSLRTFVILPLICLNIWMIIWTLVHMLQIYSNRQKLSRWSLIAAASVLISDGAFVYGKMLDSKLIAESKARGDLILQSVEKFDKRNGRLPESLEELSRDGFELPQPALKGSKFSYSPKNSVSFNSVSFLTCKKKESWICDD